MSSRAFEDAYNSVFVANADHEFDEEYKFHEMHGNALMYWLALRELEPLGLHHQIFIALLRDSGSLRQPLALTGLPAAQSWWCHGAGGGRPLKGAPQVWILKCPCWKAPQRSEMQAVRTWVVHVGEPAGLAHRECGEHGEA